MYQPKHFSILYYYLSSNLPYPHETPHLYSFLCVFSFTDPETKPRVPGRILGKGGSVFSLNIIILKPIGIIPCINRLFPLCAYNR